MISIDPRMARTHVGRAHELRMDVEASAAYYRCLRALIPAAACLNHLRRSTRRSG